jgi:PRTRC genetic system protein A
MFPIHINDGQTELPKDDVFYVIAKDGIYLRKKLGIMDSLVPVKNISILQDITSTARLNIKKIPAGKFAQIIAFFKEVYNQHKSEAIVLLFYNEKTKVYKVVPPAQKVSSASLSYDRGLSLEGWTMVGDIHSHAGMSAFHSGTDQDDELSFDGLHITLGNMRDDNVSISASIVSNGHRVIINPEDYVNRLVKTKDVDEVETKPTYTVWRYDSIKKKMIQDEAASSRFASTTHRKLDKRFTVDVSKKYFKVPDGWMDMVEHSYQRWHGHGYSHGHGKVNNHYHRNQRSIEDWENRWGQNYNSDLWSYRPGRKNPKQLELFDKSGNKTIAQQNAEAADMEDVAPCLTCQFKDFKLLLEENDLEEDKYKCTQCDCIWDESSLTDSELCPVCVTGDFLFLCEEEENTELRNEYIPGDEHDHLFVKDPSIEVKSDFCRCGQCGETFHLYSGESKCPFCYAMAGPISQIPKTSVQQEDIETQMKSDSGEFLGEDTEAINTTAKEEIIANENNTVEKLPDPSENQFPLPETSSPSFAGVRAMLDRVFNKRG